MVNSATTTGPPYQLNVVLLEIWKVNLGVSVLVDPDDDGRLVDVADQAVPLQTQVIDQVVVQRLVDQRVMDWLPIATSIDKEHY